LEFEHLKKFYLTGSGKVLILVEVDRFLKKFDQSPFTRSIFLKSAAGCHFPGERMVILQSPSRINYPNKNAPLPIFERSVRPERCSIVDVRGDTTLKSLERRR
jgi:hypothetical protein